MVAHATAAEFGEVTVHSFAGQPLVADIALTALAPDELTGLQVRLASPDVYRGANVRVHPALASMRMAVMRGDGGQHPFVHITTRQTIDADYLHLFLELSFGDRHSVRTVTIWLAPAPPMAPVPPMMPAAPVAKAAPEAPAAPVVAAAPRAANEAKHAPKPEAKHGSKPGPKHRSKSESEAEAERERADQQIKDSAALGIENDALRSKISILEEKVAVLQQDYAAKPVAAVSAVAPVAVPRSVPAPVAAKAGLGSWIAAAAVLLLLVASGVLGFLYRKKIIASRHWVALSKRFKRKVKPADAN